MEPILLCRSISDASSSKFSPSFNIPSTVSKSRAPPSFEAGRRSW